MRRKAFTLAEIAIYAFLSLLAMGLVVTLIRETRRLFGQSTASFLVDRTFDKALATLRGDLEETSLTSIRVYPGPPGAPGEREGPGLSLATAAEETTAEGVPRWNRHVFYALQGEPGQLTANLMRWEIPMDDPGTVPVFSPLLPSTSLTGAKAEVVLRGVQQPGTTLPGISASAVGPQGGFQIGFLRRIGAKEQLSPWNPAEVCLGKGGLSIEGNTALVELELRVWRPADSVSASQYAVVRCRVCPRRRP